MVTLKGSSSKAQGVSPGDGVAAKTSPERAAQTVPPVQGYSLECSKPRAHALGFAVPPLQGWLGGCIHCRAGSHRGTS